MTSADEPTRAAPARARRPRRGGLLLVGRWVTALLSITVLVGSGVAWATYRDFTTSVTAVGDLADGNASGAADIDGVDQNILLVGNDTRVGATAQELKDLATEDDGGASNTDTMIVLHVPADGSKATLISFPRDSYVDIPGYGSGRINSAYGSAYNDAKAQGASETAAEGAGLLLTAKTISQLTGLTIDHYLMIKLIGFYRISNAIGGVDVCLNNAMGPATEYGQTGNGYDSGFEPDGSFSYSYSGINLKAGVNKNVEGTQAIAFVRQRHGLPNGDLDRVARQRYFLGAVFRKVSTAGVLLNPFKLQSLLSAVSSSLVTDTKLELLKLATQLQNLASGNIIGATMVTTGDETIDGADVLGVDPAAVKAQMKVLVGAPAAAPSTTPTKAGPTVAASAVTVQVLNGSGVGGAASEASTALGALGMNVVGTGDADPTDVTTVLYPAGADAQANTVAATVPGATVKLDASVTEVTLVLGADGLTPAGSATPTAPASVPASATGSRAVDTAAGGLACIN